MLNLSRRQIVGLALAGLVAAQLACSLLPASMQDDDDSGIPFPDLLPTATTTATATTTLFEALATLDAPTVTPTPAPSATATVTPPAPPPPEATVDLAQLLGGILVIENKMVWDPAGHLSFIHLPTTYTLEAVVEPQPTGDPLLDLLGDDPVVDTEMTEFVDSYETIVVETKGRGTVAGFPDVEVTFNGYLSPYGLFGYYRYGSDGSLPTGRSALYQVQGEWETERREAPAELAEILEDFIDELVEARRSNDVPFLFSRLHPAVLAMYGMTQCREYLTLRVVDPQEDFVPQGAGVLGDWVYEVDGVAIVVPEVLTIPTLATRDGETKAMDIHLAALNGRFTWFTDCGEVLP